MSKSKGSPRKFAEKIALLNKKEAEANAEFYKIIKEVEETTRAPPPGSSPSYPSRASSSSSWIDTRQVVEEQPASFDGGYNTNHYDVVHTCDPTQIQVTQRGINSPEQLSLHTPDGVPDINIYPIDDDNYQQQQVPNNTGPYRNNDCSNSISAARSLPDIANLRVSGSCTALSPSFSDQRIRNIEYNFNYDANSNIISAEAPSPCTHTYDPQSQAPTMQEASSWQAPSFFQNNCHQPQPPQQQTLHQNYYLQSQQQGPLVRANSTNTVLSSWHNAETPNTLKINNNLSKSSEVHYGYPEGQGSGGDYYGAPSGMGNQTVPANSMMRSSSYNDIDAQTDYYT